MANEDRYELDAHEHLDARFGALADIGLGELRRLRDKVVHGQEAYPDASSRDRRAVTTVVDNLLNGALAVLPIVLEQATIPEHKLRFRYAVDEIDTTEAPIWESFQELAALIEDSETLDAIAHPTRQLLQDLDAGRQLFITAFERLRILETRLNAETILGDVQEAAGRTSGVSLVRDFGTFACREYKQANFLRALAVGVLTAAFGVAVWISATEANFSWSHIIAKAIIDIPLLGAAYYFSSESRDHRSNARRADEWQIRLNTVRGYTDELPAEDRFKIRTDMGLALFREPVALTRAESMGDANGQLVGQIVEIIKSVKAVPSRPE